MSSVDHYMPVKFYHYSADYLHRGSRSFKDLTVAAKGKIVEKKISDQVQQELIRYNTQKRLKFIKTASTSGVVAVVFLLVFGLAVGGAFEGFLNVLGLTSFKNEATGIYADCSLAKNRSLRYCLDQKLEAASSDWKNASKSGRRAAKFRLSN